MKLFRSILDSVGPCKARHGFPLCMHFIIEAKLLVISCELVNTFLGFSKIGNPVKIEFGGHCLAGQWTFVWFVTGESLSQEK